MSRLLVLVLAYSERRLRLGRIGASSVLLSACTALCLLPLCPVRAQVTLSGSIQSDVLLPQEDETIGAPDYSEWALTNSFAELHLQSKYIDAGARIEYLEHPLPGFE